MNRAKRQTSAAALHPWARRTALLLLVLALAALLAAALAWQQRYVRYNHDLEQIEQRVQRLDGIVASAEQIDAELDAVSTAIGPWLHAGGDGASNEMVQQLRELIVAHGGTLASSQTALIPPEEDGLERVRISATISADWPQLMQILAALQIQQPPFWVYAASFMQTGSRAADAAQSARLSLQLDAPIAPAELAP